MRNHLGITLSLVLGALALFGAAPASADQSSTATGATPTIGAFAPVAVSTQRAIVTASINPNGSDTSCFVEWGETFAYGTVTDCSTTLSGTSNVLTSVVLQPLKANTIYHMHIVATNVNGTEATVDQAFITPVGTPPTIDVFAPTLVLVRSATVTASLNPNGQTTSCFVEYGQTTDYGLRVDCPSTYSGTSNVLATVFLQSLRPSTRYHFRMVATNHDGTTNSADQTLTTPAS